MVRYPTYKAMVATMETLNFQLYERRLNNCLAARDRCKEGSWGWTYWQDCFTILLRRMNRELNGTRY